MQVEGLVTVPGEALMATKFCGSLLLVTVPGRSWGGDYVEPMGDL